MLNDTIEYWISSSELPQNIHGANTAVRFVFFLSKRGTLVCNWPSRKLAFERFILQKACLNTGFLLHFPNPCLGLMLNSNLLKKNSVWRGFVIITMLRTKRKTAKTYNPVSRFQKKVKEGPDYICSVWCLVN